MNYSSLVSICRLSLERDLLLIRRYCVTFWILQSLCLTATLEKLLPQIISSVVISKWYCNILRASLWESQLESLQHWPFLCRFLVVRFLGGDWVFERHNINKTILIDFRFFAGIKSVFNWFHTPFYLILILWANGIAFYKNLIADQ